MLSSLSTPARAALAGLAVVAIVALGAAVMNQPQGPAATPVASATPTPTAATSPGPSGASGPTPLGAARPAPCYPGDGGSCIQAGTYALEELEFPMGVTLDVPEGWWPWDPGFGAKALLVGNDTPSGSNGSGWGLMVANVGAVSRDPCDPEAARVANRVPADQVATPADLVEIMTAWPGFEATGEPERVELGGASGLRVTLVSTIRAADCVAAQTAAGEIAWWARDISAIDAYPMLGEKPGIFPGEFTVLDVDGEFVILRITDFPQSSPFEESQGISDPARHAGEHQAELRAMLESIRFGDPTAAAP